MEMTKCITTRRSVRQFQNQPVPRAELEKAVATASYAPSWKNTQTAGYIAIEDKALLQTLAEECTNGFQWNEQIIKQAPVLVVLTTVNGRSGYEKDGAFSTTKGTHWQSFDAGIAAQTFCLAAHEQGLGTVIMGLFDEEKICQLLQLPEQQSVSALIAVGYPANEPATPVRKPVEELLSFR